MATAEDCTAVDTPYADCIVPDCTAVDTPYTGCTAQDCTTDVDTPYTGCDVASCTDTDTPYAGCNSAALGEGDECTIVDDRCDEGLSCQQQGDGSVAHCDRQNIATQATATSPDGIEPDTGGSGGDAHLAIDGDVDTYWDQTSDVAGPHILQFEFNEPTTIDAYEFMAFGVNDYSPKSWQITCDGTTIDEQVEYSQTESFFEHHAEESSECTIVQMRITDWYGGSPAIREFGLYVAAGAGGGGDEHEHVVPGCGGAPMLDGRTGCDGECAGLAYVADTGVCSGCTTDGETPITSQNVGLLQPPAVLCPPDTGQGGR